MGHRCSRFAMIVIDNVIKELKIERPGELKVSSAISIFDDL